MDKSLIDKYIAEMRAMQAVSMPSPIPQSDPPVETENAEVMSGEGGLIVNLTAVRGLYPVSGGRVSVFTGRGQGAKAVAEAYTDDSGKTPVLKLPTVSAAESETPNDKGRPFAYYNIKTAADGYIPTIYYNVAVFDGVVSVQNISLYPVASRPEGNKPIVIDEYESYEL